MSEEPKRPIESELEDWANTRRESVGAPFELHPASRRILHGEVSRLHPLPPEDELHTQPEPAGSLWSRWWRSVAVGVTAVFAIMLIVRVYRPSSDESEFLMTKAETVQDMEQRARAKDAISLRAEEVIQRAHQQTRATQTSPAEAVLSGTVVGDSQVQLVAVERRMGDPAPAAAPLSASPGVPLVRESRTETASFAGGTITASEPSRPASLSMEPGAGRLSVLDSPQPEESARKSGMSLDAGAAEGSAREAELALLAKALRQSNEEINRELSDMRREQNASAVASATATPAAVAPAVAAPAKRYALKRSTASSAAEMKPAPAGNAMNRAAGGFIAETQSTSTLSIRQEFSQAVGRPAFRRNLNSPPPLAVLQTFSVENTGSAVRIVDQDGSVYSGALETELSQVSNVIRYPFSAIGLNRTLDQQVRFTGALEVTPEGQTQVRGRASVGIRNEVEVSARPVPPR